jgi:hypothetical protein
VSPDPPSRDLTALGVMSAHKTTAQDLGLPHLHRFLVFGSWDRCQLARRRLVLDGEQSGFSYIRVLCRNRTGRDKLTVSVWYL